MAVARANINEEVLKWARIHSGFTPEAAAKKLQMKVERYQAWENPAEDLKPTFKQLRKIAKVFKRPVSVFYLAEPPEGFQVMRDFRRLPGDGLRSYSPELLYEMELAQQRRELALELYGDVDEKIPKFTLTANLSDNPEELGDRIRRDFGVTFHEQVEWQKHDHLGPFKKWRRLIEKQGILVFQMSRVPWREVSGFAVAEDQLPVIAVNRKDVPNRRTFSLIHEYAHILLRIGGASDLNVDAKRPPEEQKVEVFCNHVAAATLMPADLVMGLPDVQAHKTQSEEWEDDELRYLAGLFGVSREAFLRRLLRFNRTTKSFYELKRDQYNEEFRQERESELEQLRSGESKFRRNPPRDVFLELGRPFVRLILDSTRQDLITLNEASGYLGNLRIRHFPKLETQVYAGQEI